MSHHVWPVLYIVGVQFCTCRPEGLKMNTLSDGILCNIIGSYTIGLLVNLTCANTGFVWWLGTVHIYSICRHLMTCGHSSKVLIEMKLHCVLSTLMMIIIIIIIWLRDVIVLLSIVHSQLYVLISTSVNTQGQICRSEGIWNNMGLRNQHSWTINRPSKSAGVNLNVLSTKCCLQHCNTLYRNSNHH